MFTVSVRRHLLPQCAAGDMVRIRVSEVLLFCFVVVHVSAIPTNLETNLKFQKRSSSFGWWRAKKYMWKRKNIKVTTEAMAAEMTETGLQ